MDNATIITIVYFSFLGTALLGTGLYYLWKYKCRQQQALDEQVLKIYNDKILEHFQVDNTKQNILIPLMINDSN
jgi:hypothetical protein